jgi:glycosyltransferase involved in cell wall biosynthesis
LARPYTEREVYRLKSLARPFIQPDAHSVIESAIQFTGAKSDLTISIVVCTRNRPTLLRNCLDSLTRLSPAPDEVIVIDNTAGEKETESVAREFSARYIIESEPGLSRARNRGLFESKSEIVAYLDDDALPGERWLGFLVEPFEDPSIALVTGGIIPPAFRGKFIGQEPTRFLSNCDRRWFETAAFGGLGIGTNMALRKYACMGWKVFDERLGRGAPYQGMEEHHTFVRILSLSYGAAHVPAAIVFHSSQKPDDIKREVRNQIAYTMLLISEYPGHCLDLLRFLLRRVRRKPLSWPRDAPDPGEMVTSGWRVLLGATFMAVPFFFRTQGSKDKS